ncbi:hypothetical protein GJU94_11620 [Brucella sp. 10RB9214]|nr:hypothetical protein [Brucella sp. 10RB9212]MRN50472.1 hypothetical protein [Brucella sp. 10RB9214]
MSRAVPVKPESLERLYLFVFTHYPTQNRFALLARKCSKTFQPDQSISSIISPPP